MKIKPNTNKKLEILKKLDKYKEKDFSYKNGRIIGSMCTQPPPIAKKAYNMFLETNLGDPKNFIGTKEIEDKYIDFLCKLLKTGGKSTGLIGSGGTENNINAMWIAKNISGKKEMIVPKSAHFSFEKIASLMDMKIINVPLDENYCTDVRMLEKCINDKTAAVVGIAGSTELGTIDNIPDISDICADNNLFLHVDAAFGGFVIPFLKELGYDVPDFDFRLKGVSSISIDGHKMGCSAIPLGALILRDKKYLDSISVESHCVSSKTQAGILGTRSGGPVVAGFAVSEYLGINGYKKIVKRCMKNTFYAEKRLKEIGFNLVINPTMNVLGIKMKNPDKIVKRLSELGWRVNKMDHLSCIRIVFMPHVTKRVIDDFILVFERTCKKLGEL